MNINTNYAVAKSPNFGARLTLDNKNHNLTPEERELAERLTATIGDNYDTVEITVTAHPNPEQAWLKKGNSPYYINARSKIGGKPAQLSHVETTQNLFYELVKYLVGLQEGIQRQSNNWG